MPLQRISYAFSVTLPASRSRAFRWATDYEEDDMELMGLDARRTVQRLASDTILLTDSFRSDPFGATPGSRTVKVKLVHLYPWRWSWTSTHVSGPAQFSQFVYQLYPLGPRSSRLRFEGNQVERVSRTPTAPSIARRAKVLAREDSQLWRRLAKVMGEQGV